MATSALTKEKCLPCRQGTPTKISSTKSAAAQFYQRELPSTCIAFSSPEGKQVFTEALSAGHMEAYFGLAAQFRTQDEPAYCGLSSLVMALNTLAVDPGRVWKGPWRWYHENMLDCCVPLDLASKKGITMDEFACLAGCNTLRVNMTRVNDSIYEEDFRKVVQQLTCKDEEIIIISYSRKTLGQTGDGHFSPIGGYHPGRDLVLILDTARFKYPPHWVSLSLVFEAMKQQDNESGLPRGFIRLSKSGSSPMMLFSVGESLSLSPSGQESGPGQTLTQFLQTWKTWLKRPSTEVKSKEDIVGASVHALVKALSILSAEERLLTTQVDTCCLGELSAEHSCVIADIFQELEALPMFKAVCDVLSNDTDLQAIGARAGVDLSVSNCCNDVSSLTGSTPKSGNADCGLVIKVNPEHFITMLLLAWPTSLCGGTMCGELQKLAVAQLAESRPIFQDEVSQLSRQLRVLTEHHEKCAHCSC